MIADKNDRKRIRLQPAESSSHCRLYKTNSSMKQEWSQGPHEEDTLRWRDFTFIFDCKNVDFEIFINYEGFIRSIQSIVKYVDLDRLLTIPKDSCLTVRQVLKLGVTHKNLRELNQDFFEGFSEKEFNNYINQYLDKSHYYAITPNRGHLKEYLIDKLQELGV